VKKIAADRDHAVIEARRSDAVDALAGPSEGFAAPEPSLADQVFDSRD